jgi:hypothetical protein
MAVFCWGSSSISSSGKFEPCARYDGGGRDESSKPFCEVTFEADPIPDLGGTAEGREDLPRCGIDEGPAAGAVERMSFLDDIVYLVYERLKKCRER